MRLFGNITREQLYGHTGMVPGSYAKTYLAAKMRNRIIKGASRQELAITVNGDDERWRMMCRDDYRDFHDPTLHDLPVKGGQRQVDIVLVKFHESTSLFDAMDSAHHMGWYLLDRAAAEILVDQRPEMSIGSILEPLQQCRDEITYVWMLASDSNGRAIIKTRVHAELPEDENVWLAFRTS